MKIGGYIQENKCWLQTAAIKMLYIMAVAYECLLCVNLESLYAFHIFNKSNK